MKIKKFIPIGVILIIALLIIIFGYYIYRQPYREAGKTYAIEVKAGRKNSKTVQVLLEKQKADYILFTKGNTHGGIKENIYTIPIYGISKFKFE